MNSKTKEDAMQYYAMNGGNWFVGLFGMIFWALLFTALIILIIRLSKDSSRTITNDTGNDKSLNILRERYAKGEITKREFEEISKDLSK